jgi:hypothetical protein
MDTFRWIAIVVSMILGLGVARLLSGLVAVFRSRGQAALDWPPLVWAAAIFIQQIAFWWSLEDAAGQVATWTLPAFLMLVALVLALFLAAALVLPAEPLAAGDSLRASFEKDGRWALLALAAFNAVVILANWVIWRADPFSESVRLNLALAVVPLAGFLGSRRVQAIAAVVYAAVAIWGVIELSPAAY